MVLTVIAFILILSLLVLIHEAGHFLTAKFFKIKVEEFGIGFPPRALSFKKGETVYSINWLPVGGFVKLYGEDDAGGGKISTHHEHHTEHMDIKRAFYARPAWQRATTIVAGVVMNFVLAIILISYLFAVPGVTVPTGQVKVTEIFKGSPAALAQLQIGDIVSTVNGRVITQNTDFIKTTQDNLGKTIALSVVRNGQMVTTEVRPRLKSETPKNEGAIGIGIEDAARKKYPVFQAPFYGIWEALKFSWMIVGGLGSVVGDIVLHGTPPKGVAGPVGVAQLTGQAISYGMDAVLWFVALLSLNLAVMNVLPIPALDGGRLFFILIELVTRHKVSAKYESYTHTVGMVVLLALMALITISDVLHLLSGKSILNP